MCIYVLRYRNNTHTHNYAYQCPSLSALLMWHFHGCTLNCSFSVHSSSHPCFSPSLQLFLSCLHSISVCLELFFVCICCICIMLYCCVVEYVVVYFLWYVYRCRQNVLMVADDLCLPFLLHFACYMVQEHCQCC